MPQCSAFSPYRRLRRPCAGAGCGRAWACGVFKTRPGRELGRSAGVWVPAAPAGSALAPGPRGGCRGAGRGAMGARVHREVALRGAARRPTARSPGPARVAAMRLRSESALVPVPVVTAAADFVLPPPPHSPAPAERRGRGGAGPGRRGGRRSPGGANRRPGLLLCAPLLCLLCGRCRGHPPAPARRRGSLREHGAARRRCVPAGNRAPLPAAPAPPGWAGCGAACCGTGLQRPRSALGVSSDVT